jgi:uncharacterized membrane protein YphA (DoxX/SURF4 family)
VFVTTAIIGSVLAAMYLAAGSSKAMAAPRTVAQAAELKIAPRSYRLIGIAELFGAAGVVIGLWLPWLGIAAGIGVGLMMIGAIVAHLRVGQSPKQTVPALVGAALAVCYVVLRVLSA